VGRSNVQLCGRPHPVNDSWIAVGCLVHGLIWATYNAKGFVDYADYDGLHLIATEQR
jgi:hypothetical protein